MQAWRPSILIKSRLQHRCSPVNIAKFSRTPPIFNNICERLLLHLPVSEKIFSSATSNTQPVRRKWFYRVKMFFLSFKVMCALFVALHLVTWRFYFAWLYLLFHLNPSRPCILESCSKIKINLNFNFHIYLWCLKRFYEGL